MPSQRELVQKYARRVKDALSAGELLTESERASVLDTAVRSVFEDISQLQFDETKEPIDPATMYDQLDALDQTLSVEPGMFRELKEGHYAAFLRIVSSSYRCKIQSRKVSSHREVLGPAS